MQSHDLARGAVGLGRVLVDGPHAFREAVLEDDPDPEVDEPVVVEPAVVDIYHLQAITGGGAALNGWQVAPEVGDTFGGRTVTHVLGVNLGGASVPGVGAGAGVMRAGLAALLRRLADVLEGRRRPRHRGAVALFGGASPPRFIGHRSRPASEGGATEFRRSPRTRTRIVYRDRPRVEVLEGAAGDRHERFWRGAGPRGVRRIRRLLGRQSRSVTAPADAEPKPKPKPKPNGEIVSLLNACCRLGMRRSSAETECAIRARREPTSEEWGASDYDS